MSNGLLTIEVLRSEDLPLALRLEEQARWNQTESDWQKLLSLGSDGSFAAFWGSRLVGTVTTISYAKELAWIGMMLVDPQYRRRGLASALMHSAMDYLQSLGVSTVKLDATPEGSPLYQKFGFEPELKIERWEGIAHESSSPQFDTIDETNRPDVYYLDRIAFGADRRPLLDLLIAGSCVPPITTKSEKGRIDGYALARAGRIATYIGPLVARNTSSAVNLLDGVLNQVAGKRIYVDINTESGLGSEVLADRGFVKQRELTRMRYGRGSVARTSNMIFGIAGPELG